MEDFSKWLDDLLRDREESRKDIKQKEFIKLKLMSFSLTNNHIERDNCKWKDARFNFETLNFN